MKSIRTRNKKMSDKTKVQTASKKAAPTKKAAAKPAPKPEAVTPPAQVIVEEVRPAAALVEPDPATGPNQKFPYAIKVTDNGKIYFDRFKTAKERDRRRGALEKRVTAIENVDFAAAEAPKGPTLVKGSGVAADPSVSKRVTPGASIVYWRIARSVRVGQPGFFLQGGHDEKIGTRQRFVVGAEEHYTSYEKAKEMLVTKLPPSDDPEEVPAPSSKVN
jgi:hypothetical protein